MSVPAAIAALVKRWETTVDDLPDERLRAILRAAERPGTGPADLAVVRSAAHAIADELTAALPRRHPVRQALSGGVRLASGRSTWEATPARLAAIAVAAEVALADRAAEAALLAAPMRTGGVPAEDHLIRLGPDRTPAFQFDGAGRPVPVVLEINRLLDAQGDPWGVADWWLCANLWLDGVPAELLGNVDDRILVMAAEAELAVD
jgi:hypothetical protein